jgi:hypothetical protein
VNITGVVQREGVEVGSSGNVLVVGEVGPFAFQWLGFTRSHGFPIRLRGSGSNEAVEVPVDVVKPGDTGTVPADGVTVLLLGAGDGKGFAEHILGAVAAGTNTHGAIAAAVCGRLWCGRDVVASVGEGFASEDRVVGSDEDGEEEHGPEREAAPTFGAEAGALVDNVVKVFGVATNWARLPIFADGGSVARVVALVVGGEPM